MFLHKQMCVQLHASIQWQQRKFEISLTMCDIVSKRFLQIKLLKQTDSEKANVE